MNVGKLSPLILFLALGPGCAGDDPGTFSATGIMEGTAVRVAAQTGGQLLQVLVEEGQQIDAGSTIAIVDTQKLVYQKELLEAGLAELEVQNRINLNTLDKAQTDYDYVEKQYRRYQDLYKKNSASEQVLDDLKRAYDTAKTQLETARESLELIESKKKGLEAQLKTVNLQISDATIISPLAGTVTTKFYETGETILPGLAIAEIINLQQMWTKVYVSELILPKIVVGQSALIQLDGADRSLEGRISWISPKAEFTPKQILTEESRTSLVYAVKVTVDNPDGILKHGMPVAVALELN